MSRVVRVLSFLLNHFPVLHVGLQMNDKFHESKV